MDEIGRGTSPMDGEALSYSILRYLHDQIQCRTIFATHYHDVAECVQNEWILKSPLKSNSKEIDGTKKRRFSFAECWKTGLWENGDEFSYYYKVEPGIMTQR